MKDYRIIYKWIVACLIGLIMIVFFALSFQVLNIPEGARAVLMIIIGFIIGWNVPRLVRNL